MNDKIVLKTTISDFHRHASRLMTTTVDNFSADLRKLMLFVKNTPLIYDYINECVTNNLPSDFDADNEVDTVQKSYYMTFGPFSGSDEEETAEIFQILQAIVERGISGSDPLFNSYSRESNKYQDRLEGFLKAVVFLFINHVNGHLTKIGLMMQLDDSPLQQILVNNSSNTQISTASSFSTVNAIQKNNPNISELEPLLAELVRCSESMSEENRELVQDSIQTLREELMSGSPKKRVVNPLIALLKGIDGGTQFAAAVTQIITFFTGVL